MAQLSKPNAERMTDADINRMQTAVERREAAMITMRRQTSLGDLYVRMRDASEWAASNIAQTRKTAKEAAEQYQLLAFEAYSRAAEAAKDAGLVR